MLRAFPLLLGRAELCAESGKRGVQPAIDRPPGETQRLRNPHRRHSAEIAEFQKLPFLRGERGERAACTEEDTLRPLPLFEELGKRLKLSLRILESGSRARS